MSLEDPRQVITAYTRLEEPPLVPEFRLHLAAEITPIWEAMEALHGGRQVPPPYWAFAWAGSVALARLVLDHPELVLRRQVLDFASGCGLAGLAAARSGADRVLCLDVDPLAETAVRMNAAINGLTLEASTEDHVGRPLPEAWEVILAGDICYEQPTSGRVLAWLRGLAGEGRLVLLADPGRAYAPEEGLEEVISLVVPTPRDLESRDERITRVYRLLPRE